VILVDDGEPLEDGLPRLRRSLQALARTGSSQPALFPEFRVAPDHLVLEFDQAAAVAREHHAETLTPAQQQSLDALEEKFHTMSRDGAEFDADLWTDAALSTSPRWAEIRALAEDALAAFGWTELAEADAASGSET
jgi:hypothetical protein